MNTFESIILPEINELKPLIQFLQSEPVVVYSKYYRYRINVCICILYIKHRNLVPLG